MRKLLIILFSLYLFSSCIFQSKSTQTLDIKDKELVEHFFCNTIPNHSIINNFQDFPEWVSYTIYGFDDSEMLEENVIYVNSFENLPSQVLQEINCFQYNTICIDITIREKDLNMVIPSDIELEECGLDPSRWGITKEDIESYYFWESRMERRIELDNEQIYQIGVPRIHAVLEGYRP